MLLNFLSLKIEQSTSDLDDSRNVYSVTGSSLLFTNSLVFLFFLQVSTTMVLLIFKLQTVVGETCRLNGNYTGSLSERCRIR